MDAHLRQLERLSYQDIMAQAQLLRARLRINPGMRKNLEFAAWMGDSAASQMVEEIPHKFTLKFGKEDGQNHKTWRVWKFYTRVLGKAPALAALIPCIRYKFPEERIQKELIEHYRSKIKDKKYKPRYEHPILVDAPARSWAYQYAPLAVDFEGPTFNKKRHEELNEFMRVLSGPGYYSNHAAASARIIKNCTLKYVRRRWVYNKATPELEAAIKQSCIDWALDR